MGYRSDLKAAIHAGDMLDWLALLESVDLRDCFVYEGIEEGTDYHIYYAESLKWYDTYLNVGKVNAFINNSEKSGMVRSGEEAPDIEHFGKQLFEVSFKPEFDFYEPEEEDS